MFMRRALDPDFDAKTLVPAVMELVGKLLNVREPAAAGEGKAAETRR